MRKLRFLTFSLFWASAAVAAPAALPLAQFGLFELPFVKVLDPQSDSLKNWMKESNVPVLNFSLTRGIATLEVEKSEQPWAAIMKTVTVNLDRYPNLEVNVLASTKRWYLIVSGKQIKDGFVRLIESASPGHYIFDLQKLTQLSGTQKLEVKIGVSDPSASALAREELTFNMLAFLAPAPTDALGEDTLLPTASIGVLSQKQDESAYKIFTPNFDAIDLWLESYKGGPQEVRFNIENGLGIVKGEMSQRSWGAVHRDVKVDLSKYPALEITVLACSKSWFLLINNPALSEGTYRFIETDKPGVYRFNVAQLTGLSGEQDLEIQLGVSSPDSGSIKGSKLIFNRLEFKK